MKPVPLTTRRDAFALLLVSALLSAGCAATPQAPNPSNLPQQVEAARSAADHEALAQRYEQQAEQARTQAQEHRALLASYQNGSQYRWIDRVGPASSTATGMAAMPRLCELLARNADERARTYGEMAVEHRRWAQQARSADSEAPK